MWFTAVLNVLSGTLGKMFGWKEAQAKTVQDAIQAVSSIDDNDAKSVTAVANALQSILTQGSWLERNWRSWLMVALLVLIVSSWFGYSPPNINDPLSPTMSRYFDLLELGLGGYIARRGIVDIVRMFNIGSVLKALINKKVM